ncbi:unnamed protein product [Sympodiomycopsis kandeliae]
MPINLFLLETLTSPLNAEWAQHNQQQQQQQQRGGERGQYGPPTSEIRLDENRIMLHRFNMAIEHWKQDAECLKSHRAMPLSRSGNEDEAWVGVNSKTRLILRIAEERLSEVHRSILSGTVGIE